MRKAILTILVLLSLIRLCPAVSASEDVAAARTRSNGHPYYVMVNRTTNTVTVYGLDEDGYYTRPLKAMICSTGRAGRLTPRGTYTTTSTRKAWCLMVDGSYGQYSTQFRGHILFHSVCYSRQRSDSLITEEYNQLGTSVSMGCVRLQVADAKWIYDNCEPGTLVTVYESEDPGPLGKPSALVPHIPEEQDNGWEPTDPDERNPWRERIAQSVALAEETAVVTAGEQVRLTASVLPMGAQYPEAVWTSSNPDAAQVDGTGVVTGLGEGEADIRVSRGTLTDVCHVTVREDLLPLTDLSPGVGYYGDVRYVYEREIMTGNAAGLFRPDDEASLATVLQTLYHMALNRPAPVEEPETEETALPWYNGVLSWLRTRFPGLLGNPEEESEPAEEAPPPWYAGAVEWASKYGILDRTAADGFDPDETVSRRKFALLLYRFAALYGGGNGTEDGEGDRDDAPSVTVFAAVRWAEENGLLKDSSPGERSAPFTRAELAEVLHRFDEWTSV